MYSYEEVQEELKKGRLAEIRSIRPRLQEYEREAIPAEKLTQNDDWRIFLQIVEGSIAWHKDVLAQEEGHLANPQLLNYEDILRRKVRVAELRAYLRALEQMSEVPKRIEERAVDAAHQLKLIEEPAA